MHALSWTQVLNGRVNQHQKDNACRKGRVVLNNEIEFNWIILFILFLGEKKEGPKTKPAGKYFPPLLPSLHSTVTLRNLSALPWVIFAGNWNLLKAFPAWCSPQDRDLSACSSIQHFSSSSFFQPQFLFILIFSINDCKWIFVREKGVVPDPHTHTSFCCPLHWLPFAAY